MIHNEQISVAKGIGITLMVIGHSGCPYYLESFISLFHMILFYFVSGFFFRDEKIARNGKKFVLRKIRSLYWPYIKWSVIFILLHNFFFYIGFNEDELSANQMFINIKRAIRGMWQGEHFLGAYWFLISLFWEIILFSLIIWLKHKIHWRYFTLAAVFLLFGIGIFSNYQNLNIYINRELMVLPFFYSGYLCGNYIPDIKYKSIQKGIAFFVCLPILCFFASFTGLGVGANHFGNLFVYILSSICGVFLILVLSQMILDNTFIAKIFDRIGLVTLHIMTFHFLCIKILSAIIIFLGGYSKNLLTEWPVPKELTNYWILYSLVGTLGPCVLYYTFQIIKKKIYFVN